MIAAVLGNVNGHAEALEKCLAFAEDQGILTVIQTGNLAVGDAGAARAVGLLSARDVVVVQGHQDRALVRYARNPGQGQRRLDPAEVQAMERALAELSSAQLEWLNALPRRREFEIDGTSFYVCHGAPGVQSEVLSPETPLQRLQRHREAAPVDMLLCGGAPAAFDLLLGETLFVCPGPVREGADAVLSLVSTEEQPARVELVRLPLSA